MCLKIFVIEISKEGAHQSSFWYDTDQGSKKQIVLLSRTSKSGGGQVDLKGTCPQDKFCKINW